MKRIKASLLGSSILVAMAALVPGQAAAANACGTTGGTLVVAMTADILRTDLTLASDTQVWYIGGNVMQGLVGPKPGAVAGQIPVLATEMPTLSADGLTYSFKLREGVTFHDGTPFDAEAVKFNFDRWVNMPAELQPFAPYTGSTIGFGEHSIVAAVNVTGSHAIDVVLKEPNSSFLNYLAMAGFTIASPAALKAGGADGSVTDITQVSGAQGGEGVLVGTGPFKFGEWVRGDHTAIVKNEEYWDEAGIPCLDQVVFRPISSPTATLAALQAGDVDFAFQVGPTDVATIDADPNLEIVERGESCNIFELALNQGHKPLDNPEVRRAIAHAVNKPALIDSFYAGYADPADGFLPAAFEFVTPIDLPKYDPEEARKILAATGLSPEELTIDFWYPSNVARPYMPDVPGIFQALAADLEAVGITVRPKSDVWAPNYLDSYVRGVYPMFLMGTICQWASADNFLLVNLFGTVDGQPRQQWNYRNDTLQTTMEQALGATNATEAARLWGEAQDILAVDIPIVPLINARPPAAARSNVEGFVSSGNLREQMNTVWLAE